MEVLNDFELEIICGKCHKPVYFSSRTELKDSRQKMAKQNYLYRGENNTLCNKCLEERYR